MTQKQQLLNNPLVKQIALEYAGFQEEGNWKDYYLEQMEEHFKSLGECNISSKCDCSPGRCENTSNPKEGCTYEVSKEKLQAPKKDYEILSFKYINYNEKGQLVTLRENGNYLAEQVKRNPNSSGANLLTMINQVGKLWNIHSVKRLSDGEVFTIGDWTTTTLGDRQIEGFEINESIMNVTFPGFMFSICNSYFNKVKKVKLFTTEDGVDIYQENAKLFEVILSTFHLNCNIPLAACNDMLDKRKDGYPSKVFSTKEKAEEYILLNKPCLSINDLRDNISYWDYQSEDEIKLKDLVKSKLNNEN